MRRRLDVAAALVQRPPVLFLDEPTTGLDLHSRNELWKMIRELVAEGTTVLLTTQYLEEADRLADDIAVVDGGRVIARGTPAGLKSRLGSTVIEIALPTESHAARAETVLAPIASGRPEREGERVRLTSDNGARFLMDVLRALDAEDLDPGGMTVREPSLDDVFLSLTGRHAEPAAAPDREDVPAGRAP
jgi:ABC-2 type transport system ATP-binding protein